MTRHSRAWHQMHDEFLAERALGEPATARRPDAQAVMVNNPARDLCGTVPAAGLELDLWGGNPPEPAPPDEGERHVSRQERRARGLQTGDFD